MAKAALAFAAGFGTGYLNQKRQSALDAERQEDRDMRKQEFADQQEERDRLKRSRARLAQAGELRETNTEGAVVDGLSTKPVLYEDANVASGDLRQDRRLREASAQTAQTADPTGPGPGLGMQLPATPPEEVQDSTSIGPGSAAPVAAAPAPAPTMRKAISSGGQEYATREEADAATKKYNDGRGERISQELYLQGDPGKAMQMDAGTMELQEKKRSYAQKMIDEGAIQVAKASRGGDPEAVRAAANASGEYKIEGEIKVVPRERELSGLGKIPTYDYTFNAVGKDGKPREMSFNSHDLSMQTLEYKEILEAGFKGKAADDKTAYQLAASEANLKRAEAAELRAGIYGGGAGRGAGAGAGSKAAAGFTKDIDEAVDRANSGVEKLSADQLMPMRRLTEEMVVNSRESRNPIPSALAAEVAYAVTKDPALVRPTVNMDTGHINGVFLHPSRKEIVIDRDISSANKPGKLSTAEMKNVTESFLGAMPEADRNTLIESVRDPVKLKTVMDELYVLANQQGEARAKANPRLSAAENKAWVDNYKTEIRAVMQRKVSLVERFGPKAKAETKKAPATVANPLAENAPPAAAATPGLGMGMGANPLGRSRAPGLQDGNVVGGLFSASASDAPAQGASPTRMGDDFESPGARAALADRVRRQGANGAPPLSDVELLRARQLGLV